MGLRRSKAETIVASAQPNSVIGSAVRLGLSDAAWRGYRFTDEAWQKSAWDFYDTNGQLHNSVEYVGSACSMIRIYVAHVDENGVRQGEVEDDPEIAALADSLFGGPANKAEMLRGIGESLTVAGEVFILGKAAVNDLGDQWWTAAPSEVRRNGDIVYVNMGRAMREELHPGRDLIIRCWTPHPRRHYLADSPVRAILGLLSEMADMMLFVRAQLTSRIANATILPVPSTLSVPRGDDQSVSNDDIYEQIFEVITSNLEGRGTAAQVAPILWQMPLEELKAMAGIIPIRFDSPLSDQAIQLRAEQQGKLAIAMNVPVEIQVGGQEMSHWCPSIDTEVYTQLKGWVTEEKLNVGDVILTLNHETGNSEWHPIDEIYRANVVDEPMLSIEGRYHSSLTTMNHRWPVLRRTSPYGTDGKRHEGWTKEWITSAQMLERPARLILGAPHRDINIEAKYTDALVEVLAWMSTDSNLTSETSRGRRALVIRQSRSANPHKVARIRAALTELFGPAQDLPRGYSSTISWSERDDIGNLALFRVSAAATEKLLELAPDRKVKLEVIDGMTKAQLEMFINVSMMANGHRQKDSSTVNILSVDRERLEAAERAAILLGYRVSLIHAQTQSGFGAESIWRLSIGIRTEFSVKRENMSVESYTGGIWCPSVPATSSFIARRNGKVFYTGNSIWWAGEEFITKTIMPLFNRIVDALNTAYLQPALKKLGREGARYTYWYDTAPLANTANKLADTLNLYERGIVSGDEVLRAGNYNKSAKPTRMEEATRFIKEVILRDPTLFANDAVREAINIFVDTSVAPQELTTPPPPPPAPERVTTAPKPGQKPIQPAQTDAVTQAQDLVASVSAPSSAHVAANAAVIRALELAGKRMLSPSARKLFPDADPCTLHTKLRVSDDHQLESLLASAWDRLPDYMDGTGVSASHMQPILDRYTRGLILRSIEHRPSLLSAMLKEAGVA